jgi:uncharacterized protein
VSGRQGARPRRVPRRTCVACRQERAKRELIRVVRTADGLVEVDPSGKKAGRGAYLCSYRDCWEAALGRKVLEHALKTTMTAENRSRLQEYGTSLSQRPSPTDDQVTIVKKD